MEATVNRSTEANTVIDIGNGWQNKKAVKLYKKQFTVRFLAVPHMRKDSAVTDALLLERISNWYWRYDAPF